MTKFRTSFIYFYLEVDNSYLKKKIFIIVCRIIAFLVIGHNSTVKANTYDKYPLGKPGLTLAYRSTLIAQPGSNVDKFTLALGEIEEKKGVAFQWLFLNVEKANRQRFSLALLCTTYPSEIEKQAQHDIMRYILTDSEALSVEYYHQTKEIAVLPSTGAWKYLLPRSENGDDSLSSLEKEIWLLGHTYILDKQYQSTILTAPATTIEVSLLPERLIGVPHNAKVKNESRRFDESDYEYVSFTKKNYSEMMEAGMNCFRVNAEEALWLSKESVYYWGVGGEHVSYPECLYKSNYIGPVLFFDEPMVGTRDHIIKPKLKTDPDYRKTLTPQIVFKEFQKVFREKKYEHGPVQLLEGLSARKDVDIGDMNFLQQNMYTWETMPSSALYQLSEGKGTTPSAMVFEPPGRFGSRRILPELNMCFDCQIPIDNPKNLSGIIFGFLRGAARATDKEWGMSIYGQVDRADAFWLMTHAYDQGATRFFYWDSYQLAAVPYNEYLAISDHLSQHAKLHPNRNLEKLKRVAEVAIIIPAGYNLGHVKMGLGSISGLPELNMERKNSFGVTYREVMNSFLVEIERCIRLGIEYDLFWNLEKLELNDYRELVFIHENGDVEITKNGNTEVLKSSRDVERPEGNAPALFVEVGYPNQKSPATITAIAKVSAGSAPVYYTMGADKNGIYNNQYVIWELFGPEQEDYTDLWNDRWNATITEKKDFASIEIEFKISKPGTYRMRVAASDVAGRSSVVWKNISISK